MEELKDAVGCIKKYYERVELEELATRLCWGEQGDEVRDDYRRVARELISSYEVLKPSGDRPQSEAS
nr:MAG TPA: hypothetical protein [Caudoviricetes sp.]